MDRSGPTLFEPGDRMRPTLGHRAIGPSGRRAPQISRATPASAIQCIAVNGGQARLWDAPWGLRLLYTALGLFLVLSAALKADAGALFALEGARWLGSTPLLLAIVWVETALGCWLFTGIGIVFARKLLVACFGVFALITLSLAIAGATSCGCLGRLPADPRLMFAVDLAVLLLVLFVPCSSSENGPNPKNRWCIIALGATAVLSLGGWHTMGVLRNTTTELGATADGRLVILEPAQWLGRVFPLYPDITWAGRIPRLADGEWTVVLHRAGCSGCRILVPQLQTRVSMTPAFTSLLWNCPPIRLSLGSGQLAEISVKIQLPSAA